MAEIYNAIFNTHLDLGLDKRTAKIREEESLLREVCQDNPDHFNLIQQAVKVVKTKSLLRRKRGLYDDIEQVLDNYLREKEAA
ncbi:MAG TPA: hypothetical protein VFO93_14810 [Hymenobacter sp.]|uniref:hypothetical protein n=1 Tax=Hymenobacter sp. TaxID=1898978 RepID=UPI002D7E6BD2|nr:hypothetical protein [Hymenobacter sp.]HET9504812.1 hypothetical protein [Hymenobacter sp.]